MKHSLEDEDDEADSMKEEKEPGAPMEHEIAIPWVILKAFMDENLTTRRMTEHVV